MNMFRNSDKRLHEKFSHWHVFWFYLKGSSELFPIVSNPLNMDASWEQKWYFDFVTLQSPLAMKVSHLPMAWAIWVTRLVLGISILSDAMVLQQIELVDLQKLQRLCMVLCAMDVNGFSMIWDPQWFDSLGHFLPSHRYELCALPSFLLSILMPFTSPFSPDHIFAPLGDPLGPCLRKEEAAMEEHEAGRIAALGNGDPELKGSRFRF